LKKFKETAKNLYLQLNQARAEGKFETMNTICTKDFYHAGKAKWPSSKIAKGLRIEWNCTDLKAKVISVRYLDAQAGSAIMQITVRFTSNQVC
jgi:hypothetical protein